LSETKQGFFALHSSHLKFGNNSKTLRKETSNHNAALGDVPKVSTFKMAADSSHLVARFPEFFFTSLCNPEQGWQPGISVNKRHNIL
jgi:hypothetical protein